MKFKETIAFAILITFIFMAGFITHIMTMEYPLGELKIEQETPITIKEEWITNSCYTGCYAYSESVLLKLDQNITDSEQDIHQKINADNIQNCKVVCDSIFIKVYEDDI